MALCRLHRIALEIIPNPQEAYTAPISTVDGFSGAGSYLSCLGENVGVRKSETGRMPCTPDGSPNLDAGTPSSEDMNPFDAPYGGLGGDSRSRANSLSVEHAFGDSSNDGGKVKKARRLSSATASPINGPIRGRKRGASTGSLLAEVLESSNQQWQQDAGEAGCWTIATTGRLIALVSANELTSSPLHRNRSTYVLHPASPLRRSCTPQMQGLRLSRLLHHAYSVCSSQQPSCHQAISAVSDWRTDLERFAKRSCPCAEDNQ